MKQFLISFYVILSFLDCSILVVEFLILLHINSVEIISHLISIQIKDYLQMIYPTLIQSKVTSPGCYFSNKNDKSVGE